MSQRLEVRLTFFISKQHRAHYQSRGYKLLYITINLESVKISLIA